MGSQKHKAKLAYAGNKKADDDDRSMISSTFSLGEPTIVNKDEIDSDAEDEFNEVVDGINKTTLKEIPNATRRPSRPTHSADLEKAESETTDSATDAGVSLEKSLKRCLFCNFESASVELNTGHMERIHGMFIPEREFLVNLEGLVASLYEKIHEFHECLYCGKLKPSVFGLQTHMRDKGHCKIPFHTEEEQLEIGEFYDFRSTYSDYGDEESDSEEGVPEKESGGVKLGAKRRAKITSDDDEGMENADGWETDSSESSLDSDDLSALPLDQRTHAYQKLDKHPHHTSTDPRPHHNTDGWHSHAHKHAHAVFHSEYELHLPSGRTAGHRSLNKYYRQNLVNHPSPAERQEQLAIEAARGSDSSEEEVDARVARFNERERGRALTNRGTGGRGMVGVTAEKKKEVATEIKRSKKVEERAQRRNEWKNNKQANMQKHFRVSHLESPPVIYLFFDTNIIIRILSFNDLAIFSTFLVRGTFGFGFGFQCTAWVEL